jgi:excisionase family DNA binding protein
MSIEVDLADTKAAVVTLVHQVAELTAAVQALRTPAQSEPTMLTVREFAARAGLSTCTVRRHIADGTIPHTRVGASIRVPASALQVTDRADIAALARTARAGT